MRTLPPLPTHVGFLTSDEDARLERTYPHVPRSSAQCEICQGTGTFCWYDDLSLPLARRTAVQWRCSCRDQLVLQRYLLHSGVSRTYGKLTWADTGGVPAPTRAFCAQYATDILARARAGLGVYLHGEHGAGKTLMVTLLAKRGLLLGLDVYVTTLDQMISAYTETWYGTKEDRIWFEHRIRNARLLVVDDMGREFEGRTSAESSVDAIFRTRVQAGLATLVTTNISREIFAKRYTKGMVSLIDEVCQQHEVSAPDYRPAAQVRALAEAGAGLSRPYTFG